MATIETEVFTQEVKGVTQMLIKHWTPTFTRRYGGDLPEEYCCVDLETTGFSRKGDVIVEFGYCYVEGGKVVDRRSIKVNWFDRAGEDGFPKARYLEDRLLKVKKGVEFKDGLATGNKFNITPEVLKEEGVDPMVALEFMYDYLETVQGNDVLLVMQNGYNFDESMLMNAFDMYLHVDNWKFGDDAVFDTGAVVKITQRPKEPGILPGIGETLREYFTRINNRRLQNVKHNLKFCCEYYKLHEHPEFSYEGLHGADYDAFMCHLLFEKFRELMDEPDETHPTTKSPKLVKPRPKTGKSSKRRKPKRVR